SKVTVVYKGDNVTVGTGNKTIGTNPDTRVVLDQFYKINKETLGEFLRLEYTGLQIQVRGNFFLIHIKRISATIMCI
ncbi:hypothetical protein ACEE11_08680, partial [Lactobacillus amylovorus]